MNHTLAQRLGSERHGFPIGRKFAPEKCMQKTGLTRMRACATMRESTVCELAEFA